MSKMSKMVLVVILGVSAFAPAAKANWLPELLAPPPIPLFSPIPIPPFVPLPEGPTIEPASPFPPCAFCAPSYSENPGSDLPIYEEMNPNTDPVPPTEAVPELVD